MVDDSTQSEKVLKLYKQGFTEYNNGRYLNAIHYFDKCLQINPKYVKSLHALSNCYIKLNELTLAKHYLEMAIDIEPENLKYITNLKVIEKILQEKNEI